MNTLNKPEQKVDFTPWLLIFLMENKRQLEVKNFQDLEVMVLMILQVRT